MISRAEDLINALSAAETTQAILKINLSAYVRDLKDEEFANLITTFKANSADEGLIFKFYYLYMHTKNTLNQTSNKDRNYLRLSEKHYVLSEVYSALENDPDCGLLPKMITQNYYSFLRRSKVVETMNELVSNIVDMLEDKEREIDQSNDISETAIAKKAAIKAALGLSKKAALRADSIEIDIDSKTFRAFKSKLDQEYRSVTPKNLAKVCYPIHKGKIEEPTDPKCFKLANRLVTITKEKITTPLVNHVERHGESFGRKIQRLVSDFIKKMTFTGTCSFYGLFKDVKSMTRRVDSKTVRCYQKIEEEQEKQRAEAKKWAKF